MCAGPHKDLDLFPILGRLRQFGDADADDLLEPDPTDTESLRIVKPVAMQPDYLRTVDKAVWIEWFVLHLGKLRPREVVTARSVGSTFSPGSAGKSNRR